MTNFFLLVFFGLACFIVLASLAGRYLATGYMRRYRGIAPGSGVTGGEFARKVIEIEGVEVDLQEVDNRRDSEFSIEERKIRVAGLKESSLLTLGITAHELAHAAQYESHRLSVVVVSLLDRVGVFLASLFPLLAVLGFVLVPFLLRVALATYLLILFFLLLEVILETDASRKALGYLDKHGDLTPDEFSRLKKLLGLAILTRLTEITIGFLALIDLNKER